MPTSVPKKRSRIAVLAVLALIASALFAATASPVGATPGTSDNAALMEACPDGITTDPGFTDTAGNFAEANIWCLYYYGVTMGTSATTYSPGDNVTRWQMALFLIRAAAPAGITIPTAVDQGFTDIGHLPQATQDAINQLAQLGITTGNTATTYDPDSPVQRWQMALFLARFLNVPTLDLGPGGGPRPNAQNPDDAHFTDIAGIVQAIPAIYDIFELGITTGRTATTFVPFDPVRRDEMAAFINRTLDHTNARPAGINIQAWPAELSGPTPGRPLLAVSVRDTNFVPQTNVWVDVYGIDLDDEADAHNADGTCDTAEVFQEPGFDHLAPAPIGFPCTIEANDWQTNALGNIGPVIGRSDDGPAGVLNESTIWWAWQGMPGATFDADTTAFSTDTVTVATMTTGVATDVQFMPGTSQFARVITGGTTGQLPVGGPIDGWPGTQTFVGDFGYLATPFGASGYTAQLMDGPPGAPATDNVGRANVNVWIVYDRYVEGIFDNRYTVNAVTDANGLATFTFNEADPQPTATHNNTVQYDIVNVGNNAGLVNWRSAPDIIGGTALVPGFLQWGDNDIAFDDDPRRPALLIADGDIYSAGGAFLEAGATLYDQYGAGLPGVTVAAETNDIGPGPGFPGGLFADKPALDNIGAGVYDDVTDANGHVELSLTLPNTMDEGYDRIQWFLDDGGCTDWDWWIGPGNFDFSGFCNPLFANSNDPWTGGTPFGFLRELHDFNQSAYFAQLNPFSPVPPADGLGNLDASNNRDGVYGPWATADAFMVVLVDYANNRLVAYFDGPPGNTWNDGTEGEFWVLDYGNEPAGTVFGTFPATIQTMGTWEWPAGAVAPNLVQGDTLRVDDSGGVPRIWLQGV
jgi:hypothetical protein